MKIKRLNESFELVKPEEETIDTVEVVGKTLTEASENAWDKLVKAYPELTIADGSIDEELNPYERLVAHNPDLDSAAYDKLKQQGRLPKVDTPPAEEKHVPAPAVDVDEVPDTRDPYVKLTDMYPDLKESVSDDEEDRIREQIRVYFSGHPYPADMDTEDIAEEVAENLFDIDYNNTDSDMSYIIFSEVENYLDSIDSTDTAWDEYDDQYEFDNEDDVVEQDRMHAALYGGDREYCDKCGSKLVMDEWGGSCPKCNAEEIFDAKYDDDASYFDEDIDGTSAHDTTKQPIILKDLLASVRAVKPELQSIIKDWKATVRYWNKQDPGGYPAEEDSDLFLNTCKELRDVLCKALKKFIPEDTSEWIWDFELFDPRSQPKFNLATLTGDLTQLCDVYNEEINSLTEAKEKVSAHAKKILSPLTKEEAAKRALDMVRRYPDCDGVCYGIGNDFFEPYCVTVEEAQQLGSGKELVYVRWNRK